MQAVSLSNILCLDCCLMHVHTGKQPGQLGTCNQHCPTTSVSMTRHTRGSMQHFPENLHRQLPSLCCRITLCVCMARFVSWCWCARTLTPLPVRTSQFRQTQLRHWCCMHPFMVLPGDAHVVGIRPPSFLSGIIRHGKEPIVLSICFDGAALQVASHDWLL